MRHGSTSGALDADALFYLRQRGLDEDAARALLIEAFLGEVIDGIDVDGVRDVFRARVNKLAGGRMSTASNLRAIALAVLTSPPCVKSSRSSSATPMASGSSISTMQRRRKSRAQ